MRTANTPLTGEEGASCVTGAGNMTLISYQHDEPYRLAISRDIQVDTQELSCFRIHLLRWSIPSYRVTVQQTHLHIFHGIAIKHNGYQPKLFECYRSYLVIKSLCIQISKL